MRVCESVPTTTWPGSGESSMTLLWQMASEPRAPPRDLAVEPDPLLRREVLLRPSQVVRQLEQPHLHVLRRHHLVEEREVIAEEVDRSGSVTFASAPTSVSKKIAAIGVTYSWRSARRAHETASPGCTAATPSSAAHVDHHVPRDDLLASVIGRRAVVDRRAPRLALQPRLVVREEPAVLDDLALIASSPRGELRERDLLAAADALDQAEVGRREQADVLAVLPVDLLDAFGDDHAGCRPRISA